MLYNYLENSIIICLFIHKSLILKIFIHSSCYAGYFASSFKTI